jgi:hypothetical protein
MGTSGAVEEIYVGGPNAISGNDGSFDMPYATLKDAADAINSKGSGSYNIIMLGSTTETSTVSFGGIYDKSYDISLTASSVSGSAITVSRGSNDGNLIMVSYNTSLTIGGLPDRELVFDGCNMDANSALIQVQSGILNINEYTTIINNKNISGNGGGIANYDILNINGATITNNYCQGYGGGIYNNRNMTMNGGSVSSNSSQGHGGGIYNNSTFSLYNGTITKNNCTGSVGYGSGIYNMGNMTIDGGTISENSGYCFANGGKVTMSKGDIINNIGAITIWNHGVGEFDMTGGTISYNAASNYTIHMNAGVFNLSGGFIINNTGDYLSYVFGGQFNMTGGNISGNTVSTVFNISDTGSFTMSDGTISNNKHIVFDTKAPITLKDNAMVSGKDDKSGSILLDNDYGAYINVEGLLSNIESLTVIPNRLNEGIKVLAGSTLTEDLLSKFIIGDPNYSIDNQGKLKYIGPEHVYYVDKVGSDYSESGSSEEPLSTIGEAIDRIGIGVGTIIIQSDLNVKEQIYIETNITIKSDDEQRTIYQMITDYKHPAMFLVGGELTLGDKNQRSGELIIEKANEEMDYLIDVYQGTLNLFNGARIQKAAYPEATINSMESVINIDGGSILDCKGVAIYNRDNSIINIVSGSISATSVANDNSLGILNTIGTINMSGGTISGFNGDNSYGIRNKGTLSLSGGTISNNNVAILNEGSLNMSGNPFIPIPEHIGNAVICTIPIELNSDLSLSEGNQILYVPDGASIGDQVLIGDEDAIRNNRDKFLLIEKYLGISELGKIVFVGEPPTYYVDETYDEDDSDGSEAKPFVKLEDAIEAIERTTKKGTIYICSNLNFDDQIYIGESDITILNKGPDAHTISSSYDYYMFDISDDGSLTLGKEGEGNDNAPTLYINGAERGESDPIISNEGVLKLYSGVKLHSNAGTEYYGGCNTGAIANFGEFYMYGGVIDDNMGYLYGGVWNYDTFIMEGGRISNCSGEKAGAVYNDSDATFIMSGGTIENNASDEGIAVYNEGLMHLSGNASIPMTDEGGNKLFLDYNSWINIDSDLSSPKHFLLAATNYFPGSQILRGNELILSNNYQKFILDTANYRIAADGTIEYLGQTDECYVDGDIGADDNLGTKDFPFATLDKAVRYIEDKSGVGTIYICSDMELNHTVEISSAIKILNKGGSHVILRKSTFEEAMFTVYGQLELGDSRLNGQPEEELLIINGNRDLIKAYESLIYNYGGILILHNGIVLEDSLSDDYGAAIFNNGTMLMKGGIIQNNESTSGGGAIYNSGDMTLLDGNIRNNSGEYGGGIYNGYGGTLSINGGDIYGNTAECAGGIFNISAILNISGGKIYDNMAEYGAGIGVLETNFIMSGGEVFGNTGRFGDENVIGRGIFLQDSPFTIFGNPSFASDNVVALYDGGFDYDLSGTFITVGDTLSDDIPTITIAKFTYSSEFDDASYYYPVGSQILKPARGYTLTAQDISKFQMLDSNYGINSQGKITASLLDEAWFSLVDAEDIDYTGSEINPTVVGMKVTTPLVEGSDYKVTYTNNIIPGTASVYITGMGNYGGTVIKTFTIKGPTHTITAHAGNNGNITPSGSVVVNYNDSQSFSIIAAAGYTVDTLMVDGLSVDVVSTFTFTNVVANHSISVTFKAIATVPTPTPQPTPTPTPPYTPPSQGGGGGPIVSATPRPTAAPVPTGPARDMNAQVSVTTGKNQQNNSLNASIGITPASLQVLANASRTSRLSVTIPIESEELIEAMQDDSIRSVNINVTLPNVLTQNNALDISRILLNPDIIGAARDNETDINVSVKDEDSKERYSWSFSGSDLAASDKDLDELDLSLSLQRGEDNEDLAKLLGMDSQAGSDYQDSLVISFGHHGDLPAQASVRMYVGDMGYSEGDKLYLYYYNSETGKLDTLPYSSNYVVDKDGYITVNIVHCSEYVFLPKQAKAKEITSLRNQIAIETNKFTLKLGSKKKSSAIIQVNLPKTLEQVEDFKDKTSGSAIGAVKITYKSGNLKVASVNSKGKITAKKSGKADITVTVTLYSGKTKTFKISVTVNK